MVKLNNTLFKKQFALLGLLIASCSIAYSQTSVKDSLDIYDMSLEEIMNIEITTATKTAGKIDAVPSVVEVITNSEIQQRGYQTLAQVLNDVCSNHEDRSNWGVGEPLNQNVGFGFRFDTGQNILILFNGQRLNAFLPGNRFGGEEYLLKNIEKIEIIRGPGSAIYGTNAFTSVINIISKKVSKADDESVSFGYEYIPTSKGHLFTNSFQTMVGKSGSLSGALRYSHEDGQKLSVKNSLFGDQILKDGVDHAIDGEMIYSQGKFNVYSKITNQRRRTFTGFNGVNPTGMDELSLSMYAYSIGSDYTFSLGKKTSLKISGGAHKDNWTEVALIPIFKSGTLELDSISIYRDGNNIKTPFFIDGQGADTRSLDGEAQFTYNFRKTNHIVIGTYVSDDRILNATRPSELNLEPAGFSPFRIITDDRNNWLFDTKASRQTLAFYTQMDYLITDKISFTAGARLDNYYGQGILSDQRYSQFNPRGGIVYSADKTGTLKFLFGRATRIPNGFETLSSVTLLGSPGNRPEQMQMLQLQWIKNWSSDFRTELGGFNATISNRLVTNADISDELKAQGYIGQFVNLGGGLKQTNNGVEGKLNYRLNRLNLLVNFTKYFASNDGNGQPIAYIPTTMINANVNVPVNWLSIDLGLNYRSGFTKSLNDLRSPVKDYLTGRLNILASPERTPVQFRLTLRNMFNAHYSYPSSSQDFYNNFPARGFELSVGVNYKFQ